MANEFSEMLSKVPPSTNPTTSSEPPKDESVPDEATKRELQQLKGQVSSLEEQVSTLVKQLEELKQEARASEPEQQTLEEETPENWEFSDEKEVYETSFTFDQWSDLDGISSFLQKDEVNWTVFPYQGNFTVAVSVGSKELAKEFNELFTEQGEALAAEESGESPVEEGDAKKQEEAEGATSSDSAQPSKEFSSESQVYDEKYVAPMVSSELTCFEHDSGHYVKIPIARKGSWKHPEYGDIEFTEKDLNELQQTIQNNELGWEPPLFYGHPSGGGAPSEGYLVSTFREGDTLFGIWSVNSTTYQEIKAGRFRYSSGEFLDNYKSKRTGEPVGSVLIGMALTNRPFIPDLPRNVALEEGDQPYMFSMELSLNQGDQEENAKGNSMTQEQQEAPKNQEQQETKLSNESAAEPQGEEVDIEKLKEERDQARQELEQVKNSYQKQLDEAKKEINSLKDYLRQREVQEKVARLEQLDIPQQEKDRHIKLIKDGSLGESEEEVIRSLEELSGTFGSTMLEQHSQSHDTTQLNEPQANNSTPDPLKDSPHAQQIQALKQQAQQRKSAV